MLRYQKIYQTLIDFVGEHYGEDPDEACYDLEYMAIQVDNALEENYEDEEFKYDDEDDD